MRVYEFLTEEELEEGPKDWVKAGIAAACIAGTPGCDSEPVKYTGPTDIEGGFGRTTMPVRQTTTGPELTQEEMARMDQLMSEPAGRHESNMVRGGQSSPTIAKTLDQFGASDRAWMWRHKRQYEQQIEK